MLLNNSLELEQLYLRDILNFLITIFILGLISYPGILWIMVTKSQGFFEEKFRTAHIKRRYQVEKDNLC